jgi:ferredoxin-NADP reductase
MRGDRRAAQAPVTADVPPQTADTLRAPLREVRVETPSSRLIRLDISGTRFDFEAGQAALIGVVESTERVPYSIASAPAETAATGSLDFLIKVEPSGRWGHQFDRLDPGMMLGVRGPFGSFLFPPAPRESRFLFIAGGTGIAPIRAMIRQRLATGHSGSMKLLYSARTTDDFAYLPELGEIALAHGMDLRLYVTRETSERRQMEMRATRAGVDMSKTGRGRIGLAQIAPLIDDPETLCFVCGPESMVADVPPMLQQLGVDRTRIKVEEW